MATPDEVARAIAIINIAIRAKMFTPMTMPESDDEKVVEANKLVLMGQQVKSIVDQVGETKVPKWPDIKELLLAAQGIAIVTQAAAGTEQPPSPQPSPSPSLPPSVPSPAPSVQAPATSAPSMVVPSTTAPSPPASPSSPPSAPQAPPEEPGAWLHGPQIGERWDSGNAGHWDITRLHEAGQIEARSVATGESTMLPAGFLKTKIGVVGGLATPPAGVTITERPDGAAEFRVPVEAAAPAPVVPPQPPSFPTVIPVPVVEHIELKVEPAENKMLFTHPGCARWMVPLDDVILPAFNTREECANCGMPFPLTVIDDGGYVPPVYAPPKEEQPSSVPQPPPVSSAPSTSSAPATPTVVAAVTPSTPASTSQWEPPSVPPSAESQSPSSVASTGAPVDDDEGDARYAKLLDGVDADFTPSHFPVPQDLENPPELMPDDLTLGDVENRRLHSQYNALSARARYLWSIQHAKSKRCDRVVKMHMRSAMKQARGELGKDATVAEVRMLAEEQQDVAVWIDRRDRHSDLADAYKEFFEIYAENVKTLSRDLTYAGTEQEGS